MPLKATHKVGAGLPRNLYLNPQRALRERLRPQRKNRDKQQWIPAPKQKVQQKTHSKQKQEKPAPLQTGKSDPPRPIFLPVPGRLCQGVKIRKKESHQQTRICPPQDDDLKMF